MAKLNKLNAGNIYDAIGQNAPVQKIQTVKAEKVPESVKEVETVSKPVEEKTVSDLLNPEQKEKKTASIYLRCKPSVKAKFDKLCEEKNISQADMFEYWIETLLK